MGVVPYAAVSLLPDALYRPLITTLELKGTSGQTRTLIQQTSIASQYYNLGATSYDIYTFSAVPPADATLEPTAGWAGSHRLFAIARASNLAGWLQTLSNPLVQAPTTATVYPGFDWAPYDLGTFSLRPSEFPQALVQIEAQTAVPGPTANSLDIAGLVMLPDNATWYLNPQQVQPSQYGWPGSGQFSIGAYTNTLLLDDTLADQFIYAGQSQTFAPSPIGSVPSSARMTPFTRGLVPRPDPKNAAPIIAIFGIGQNQASPYSGYTVGASWTNPQNLRSLAQMNVVERTRYVLP